MNNLTKPHNKDETTALMKAGGNVTALIIAIEEYQPRPSGKIPKVDFAKADAEAFSNVLEKMYPDSGIHRILLVDSLATNMSVKDGIKEAIHSTGPDDLLIIYYAGHGFYSGVSNLITVWDSNINDLSGTCLSLRELIFDPIKQSQCQKLLTFIDACAENLGTQNNSRSVISHMNEAEFKEFVNIDQYVGIFLSCSPGQKSYSHAGLSHGVWSYHLVQALGGNAEDAIDSHSVITDITLRDYLSTSVRRYITKNMSVSSIQNPIAHTTASNRFFICEVNKAEAEIPPEKDFTDLSFKPEAIFFSHIETRAYNKLPGFSKSKGHFVPDSVNKKSSEFARELLREDIAFEIESYYKDAKGVLKLRRDDFGTGDYSLDTDCFRYWVEVRQTPDDPGEVQILRCLSVRDGAEENLDKIDEIFDAIFDRVICRIQGRGPDFDLVVRRLEEVEIAYGGRLEESEHKQLATYYFPNNTRLVFDFADRRVSICAQQKSSFLDLLKLAKPIALGDPQEPIKYLSNVSQRV